MADQPKADNLFADIETKMQQAREKLVEERTALWDRIKELEDRANAIGVEITRIDNFFKPPPVVAEMTQEPKKPRAPRAPRAETGGIRQKVLEEIRTAGAKGHTAADLYAFLEMTDKSGKQSISNALAALAKDGLIHQEKRRGPYTLTAKAASQETDEAA